MEEETYYFLFEPNLLRSINANLHTYLQKCKHNHKPSLAIFVELSYDEACSFIKMFIENDCNDMSYLVKYFMTSFDRTVTGKMAFNIVFPYLSAVYTQTSECIVAEPKPYNEISNNSFKELLELSSISCLENSSFDVFDSFLIEMLETSDKINYNDFVNISNTMQEN